MSRLANILLIVDIAVALVSQVLGWYVRTGEFHDIFIWGPTGITTILYTAVVLLSGYFCEINSLERVLPAIETAARIAVSIMISFFALSALFYVAPELSMWRGVLALCLLIFGVLQYLSHRACQLLQGIGPLSQKIMILGVGPLAEVIYRTLTLVPHNYAFAGFIQPNEGLATVPGTSIVGNVEQIEEILSREKINKLVISMTERRGTVPVKNLLNCKLRGVEILDSPTFYEQVTGKLLVEGIQPSWFIYSDGFRITPIGRAWKRALDIICAFMGTLLILPFLPIIALAIRIDSPGPVFFQQRRVGERGAVFTLFKFRTMRNNAEKETGAIWAVENDPRITVLGRWLRKMRIDEIPQLFNVLKGDMSFIGPRPERPEFVESLSETIPYYGKRHFLKPGITGWAQIRYPYGASEEDALEKLRYDLYYIKNYSLTLDVIILMETVKVVLFGRGGR